MTTTFFPLFAMKDEVAINLFLIPSPPIPPRPDPFLPSRCWKRLSNTLLYIYVILPITNMVQSFIIQAFPIEYQYFSIWMIGMGNLHQHHTCRKIRHLNSGFNPWDAVSGWIIWPSFETYLKHWFSNHSLRKMMEIRLIEGRDEGLNLFSQVWKHVYKGVKWTWNGRNLRIAYLASNTQHKWKHPSIHILQVEKRRHIGWHHDEQVRELFSQLGDL